MFLSLIFVSEDARVINYSNPFELVTSTIKTGAISNHKRFMDSLCKCVCVNVCVNVCVCVSIFKLAAMNKDDAS